MSDKSVELNVGDTLDVKVGATTVILIRNTEGDGFILRVEPYMIVQPVSGQQLNIRSSWPGLRR